MVNGAMLDGTTLRIVYVDRKGERRERTIRPRVWFDGDRFTALCERRQVERDFLVSRVEVAVEEV